MEELCMLLYDRLRPIIIQVVHIETLAELCSILKTEILMENVKKNGKVFLSIFYLKSYLKVFEKKTNSRSFVSV
jgi:hypothetical protein